MIKDDSEVLPPRKHACKSQAPRDSLMPGSPHSPLTRATSASEVRSSSGTSGSAEVDLPLRLEDQDKTKP